MSDLYLDNVLRERRDITARTVTTWNAAGTLIGTRPYTASENAAADAAVLEDIANINRTTITDKTKIALEANATFLALTNPTNAQILAQTKMLTRECSALIRLVLNLLDSTSGT